MLQTIIPLKKNYRSCAQINTNIIALTTTQHQHFIKMEIMLKKQIKPFKIGNNLKILYFASAKYNNNILCYMYKR